MIQTERNFNQELNGVLPVTILKIVKYGLSTDVTALGVWLESVPF